LQELALLELIGLLNKFQHIIKKIFPLYCLQKDYQFLKIKILTLSEKIKKNLRNFSSDEINISAVKGPCLASGLANKMRTGAVLANENINIAKDLSSLIATDYYSIEITSDINGVELSGAIKKYLFNAYWCIKRFE
jgi:glycerol-3-phosphate dehydrogenase (NAD(P)+)